MQGPTRSRLYNLRSILAFSDIDKNVQLHLKNVYSTLSIGLILACVAAYAFCTSVYLQSMVITIMLVSFIASLGSSLYIYFKKHTRDTISARLAAFFIFAFATGLGMGPFLHLISIVNPESIPTAFLGASLIFVSFSLAALFTRKRYYLFLGAALMSAISMLTTFSFMNLFMRSPALYQAELYIGFAILCGFVIFDTQLIVEKRKSGDTDFIWHTLDLFIDFVELFRHLLVILNSKRNRREDDE